MNEFQSATLRLTAWYLAIIMAISLIFSMIIFQISRQELARDLQQPRGPRLESLINDPVAFENFREQRRDESIDALMTNIIILNIITLFAGGTASYFLARRTLAPIEVAMDEQSQFISDASHELRTPLAAIQIENDVALRKKKLSSADMRKLLESNVEEVQKLRALSDRLLQLSSQTPLEMHSVPLNDVTTQAINRVIPQAQAKNISIEDSVGQSQVVGNADSLTDMVVILLDNAIKYSQPNTQIVINATEEGKFARLAVIDEGKGIASADLDRIFDRFYRADESRSSTDVHGYGLGLSIAQRIASLHHTKINVKSNEGVGTTFFVKLRLSIMK